MPKLRQIATLYKDVWTSKSMFEFYCFITHIFSKPIFEMSDTVKACSIWEIWTYIQSRIFYHFIYSSICLKLFHNKTVLVYSSSIFTRI